MELLPVDGPPLLLLLIIIARIGSSAAIIAVILPLTCMIPVVAVMRAQLRA